MVPVPQNAPGRWRYQRGEWWWTEPYQAALEKNTPFIHVSLYVKIFEWILFLRTLKSFKKMLKNGKVGVLKQHFISLYL